MWDWSLLWDLHFLRAAQTLFKGTPGIVRGALHLMNFIAECNILDGAHVGDAVWPLLPLGASQGAQGPPAMKSAGPARRPGPSR